MIGSLCEDYTAWSNVLEESLEEQKKWDGFKTDMYYYASENLMQVNVYIRYNILLMTRKTKLDRIDQLE